MADTYPNFAALARCERAGMDYRVLVRRAEPGLAVVAPHGGGIEQGTSEIASAIAGEKYSCYEFEGLKPSDNSVLHITATHFDEPMCLTVIGCSAVVLTVHGEHGTEDGEGVFVGGLNGPLGAAIGGALLGSGFDVRQHPNPKLQGLEPENLCNRGTSLAGVQLELSKAVRMTLFESLTRDGRKKPTARFDLFVAAVRTGFAALLV